MLHFDGSCMAHLGSTRMNLRRFNHSCTEDYKLKKCKLKEFVSSILKPRESQSGSLGFISFWEVLQ